MANFALNLGQSKTGITDLRAQWLNSSLSQISISTSTFSEIDNGQYTFTASIPNGATYVRFHSAADSSHPYFTLAVITAPEIPESSDPDMVTAYLFTREIDGDEVPNMTVNYQRIGVDNDVDGWSDDITTVESDEYGLIQLTLARGSYYKYWIGSGLPRTVHITDATEDPYALPQVVG